MGKSVTPPPQPDFTSAAAAQGAAAANGMTVTPAYFDDVLDDAGLDGNAHLRAVLDATKAGAQGLQIAEALDLYPFNSQMWREYREAIGGLSPHDGGSDRFDFRGHSLDGGRRA